MLVLALRPAKVGNGSAATAISTIPDVSCEIMEMPESRGYFVLL
jgi:hypothetical protein